MKTGCVAVVLTFKRYGMCLKTVRTLNRYYQVTILVYTRSLRKRKFTKSFLPSQRSLKSKFGNALFDCDLAQNTDVLLLRDLDASLIHSRLYPASLTHVWAVCKVSCPTCTYTSNTPPPTVFPGNSLNFTMVWFTDVVVLTVQYTDGYEHFRCTRGITIMRTILRDIVGSRGGWVL